MAPLPKRKRSKAAQGSKMANAALALRSSSPCPQCRSPRLPHRACRVCGTYAGRQVIPLQTQAE